MSERGLIPQTQGGTGRLDLLFRGVMGKAARMLWSLGTTEGSRNTDGQIFL